MNTWILPFDQITNDMVRQVGSKNASLGEMKVYLSTHGVRLPPGFAITTAAYYAFLRHNQLKEPIRQALAELDIADDQQLASVGDHIRRLIRKADFPPDIIAAIQQAYLALCSNSSTPIPLVVRSSAATVDLTTANFSCQHESLLNVRSEHELLQACRKCYTSLFSDRAIKCRIEQGLDHLNVGLSIGVQRMVRSDLASSGVCFTVDPDSGHTNIMLITGSWGLGENIVLGNVNPDEYHVFKPSIGHRNALLTRRTGEKSDMKVYADEAGSHHAVTIPTSYHRRHQFVLNDKEVNLLASWAQQIETHFGKPMDIEWAKDGIDQTLYIVQARPITALADTQHPTFTDYQLDKEGPILCKGSGIGRQIVSGIARVAYSPNELLVNPGQNNILITDILTPDWIPLLKTVSAIITNQGGRTSQGAIAAREAGKLAIFGTGNATDFVRDGDPITVSCTDSQQGVVYAGELSWTESTHDLSDFPMPQSDCMLVFDDSSQALRLSQLPSQGVGLFRLESSLANEIGIHPTALANYPNLPDPEVVHSIAERTAYYPDKKDFFIDKLAQSIGLVAAAFYPRPVTVCFSNFTSSEYARLIGGWAYEPIEDNPLLGWHGACCFYDERYKVGFRLECEAIRRVRNDMGLTNLKLMVPFCRTFADGQQVLSQLNKYGLRQHENGLEIYLKADIPSNLIRARDFACLFDGFTISLKDLTQLTLGIDRNSQRLKNLFNENDPAVRDLIDMLLQIAHQTSKPVGIYDEITGKNAEFIEFLIKEGISHLSFRPDELLLGLSVVYRTEQKKLLPAINTKHEETDGQVYTGIGLHTHVHSAA
ncbi:phosphoenolpyruvate synthase [Spirosoma harenae]